MDDLWTKCEEPLTGRTYYFCKEMNVARWDFPQGFMQKEYPGLVKSKSGNNYTCFFARVLYDYTPNIPNVLNITKGDTIQVVNMSFSKWSAAISIKNGLKGYVPQTYYAIILPPGDPKPKVEKPNRASNDNRVRMSLSPIDFKVNNKILFSNTNKNMKVDDKPITEELLQRQIKLIESTPTVVARNEVLLYRLYCDGLLNLNQPTPKGLTFLEKYRETRKISPEEHHQTLLSIGWKLDKYNELLLSSGILVPSAMNSRDSMDAYHSNNSTPLLVTSSKHQETSSLSVSNCVSSNSPTIGSPYSSPPKLSVVKETNISTKKETETKRSPRIKSLSTRVFVSSSPVNNINEAEDEKYCFSAYASMYFQRDARRNLFYKSSICDLYMFTKDVPTTPLNRITGSNRKEALQLCQTIMYYMNDLTDLEYHNEEEYLSTIRFPVVFSNDLFEEALCFLIKQTNNHPNLDHEIKGWELFPYVLSNRVLTMNNPLYPYLMRYIVNNIFRPNMISGIALYTFKLLTGIIQKYDKNVLENYKVMNFPKKCFECSLEQVNDLEQLADILAIYNFPPLRNGLYGSINHNEIQLSTHMSGELSLKFILGGVYIPRKPRVSNIYKDKWIWVNPFLTGLCWNRADSTENYKTQDFTGFTGVISGPAPNALKSNADEFLYYSTRSFSLTFTDVNLTQDFIARNRTERDRWRDLFQILYNWYNIEGKALYDSLYVHLSNDDQDNVLKVVRDENVGFYSKDINSMIKQLKQSFIRYVDIENSKEVSTSNTNTRPSSLQSNVILPSSPSIGSPINGVSFTTSGPLPSVVSPISVPTHKKNARSDTLLRHILQDSLPSTESSIIINPDTLVLKESPNPSIQSSATMSGNSTPTVSQGSLEVSYPLLPSIQHILQIKESLSESYEDVPRIMRSIVHQLNSLHAYNNQGVFRIPGPKEQIDFYANRLSCGYYEEIDNITNIDLLTGILKNWFRSLNEPIIPYSLYNDVINFQTEEDVHNIIIQLPRINRICLKYICRFFLYYTTFEPFNQMTKSNFATCISPSLIKSPPNVDIQDTFVVFNNIRLAAQFIILCMDQFSQDSSNPIDEKEF